MHLLNRSTILGLAGTFIICNVVGALTAQFILAPLLNEGFGSTLRTAEGLQFPSLLGGYLILSLLMVWAYPYFRFSENWKLNGIIFGLLCGGMAFLSDHMITAGWSILPPGPMLISGIIDISVTVMAGLFISNLFRNGKES